MGWLYVSNLKGHKTPKAYLDDQFTFAGEHAQLESFALHYPHETTITIGLGLNPSELFGPQLDA